MIDNPKTQQPAADLKTRKKTKSPKKFYLLFTILVTASIVVIVIIALLFHRPSYYKPLDLTNSKQVSLYLTHELLPALYNGVQYQEPFNLVVTQRGINDIVARFNWPQQLGGVEFSAPMVFFTPATLVLMGTVLLEGAEFVVTVTTEPELDAEGLLNLQVVSVKLGAVDITPLAGLLAKRICQQRFADKGIDAEDLWARMAASLLDGQPFDPVFKIGDKKVRVEKITLKQKRLTIRLVPVFD